jgi:hypothetical protein
MGYAVSWLAAKEEKSAALLQRLQLEVTVETDKYGESLFSGGALPSGWWVLFINQCEHAFVRPESLASISANGEVVGCSVEEHVMWCTAELWRDGAEIWRVEHDARKGIDHLSSSGLLPEEFAAIETNFTEEQRKAGGMNAGVDYFFEIPLQTAKSIVVFKHDEATPGSADFVVLRSTSRLSPGATSDPEKKPWWKIW